MVVGLLFESILHYVLVFGGSAQDSDSLYQQNCNTGAENLNTSCWTNKCMVHSRYERKTKYYNPLLKIKFNHIILIFCWEISSSSHNKFLSKLNPVFYSITNIFQVIYTKLKYILQHSCNLLQKQSIDLQLSRIGRVLKLNKTSTFLAGAQTHS